MQVQPAPSNKFPTWLIVVLILLALCVCACLCVFLVMVLGGPAVGDIFSNILENMTPVP